MVITKIYYNLQKVDYMPQLGLIKLYCRIIDSLIWNAAGAFNLVTSLRRETNQKSPCRGLRHNLRNRIYRMKKTFHSCRPVLMPI
jgi:hypothetical protein